MLQAIRDKAQGWIAWVIVILISVPFALWGIQEYLGVGGEVEVATVEGTPIYEQALEQEARNAREDLRRNLGQAYRAELFPESLLRAQTLDRMIDQQVLQVTAESWQMRASDQMVVDAIRAERAFQTNGQFDKELYRLVLRNNAISQEAYDASVRQGMTMQQLQAGIAGSAFATKAQADGYLRLREQKRTLSYAVIPAESFIAGIKPDEDAIQTYYQAHQSQYQVPERVKLDYILLDLNEMAEQVDASPEVLKAWFDEHRTSFVAPEERQLRHILVPLEGDETAALAKAESLRAQLNSGANFADLAKTASADPGSSDKGGELGWVSRGMMGDAFEKAAFDLTEGVVSEPVKTPFGYHLILVEAVRGGGEANFDQVAEQVTKAYRKSEAERVFYERSERLAELTYENPDNLATAADTLGLTILHSDWVDRSGASGDLSSPKVITSAFSEDVLAQGNNSEVLELSPERYLVLRVVEHQQTRARDLDEVRDQVILALRTEMAAEEARKAGEQALSETKSQTELAAYAAAKGWSWKTDMTVGRDQTDVPAGVRERAFSMPRPAADENALAGVELATGDFALLALSQVQEGDVVKLDDTGRQLLANQLASVFGRMDLGSLIVTLRDRADVTISLKAPTDDE